MPDVLEEILQTRQAQGTLASSPPRIPPRNKSSELIICQAGMLRGICDRRRFSLLYTWTPRPTIHRIVFFSEISIE